MNPAQRTGIGASGEAVTVVAPEVTVRHLHPSMAAVSERLITFDVEAHDGVNTIGKGSHTRAPVELARFEAALAEPASRRCREHGAC